MEVVILRPEERSGKGASEWGGLGEQVGGRAVARRMGAQVKPHLLTSRRPC